MNNKWSKRIRKEARRISVDKPEVKHVRNKSVPRTIVLDYSIKLTHKRLKKVFKSLNHINKGKFKKVYENKITV